MGLVGVWHSPNQLISLSLGCWVLHGTEHSLSNINHLQCVRACVCVCVCVCVCIDDMYTGHSVECEDITDAYPTIDYD